MAENTAPARAYFVPLAAPILRSVDPVKVAVFLKEREQYEMEVMSRQGELPSLNPLSLFGKH